MGTNMKRWIRKLHRWGGLLTLLPLFRDGTLLRRANDAIFSFGHGRLRDAHDRELDIGGSTGGVARSLIDGPAQPSTDAFYREFLE